ncbi:MAG TPA: peptidylprolyl isomerase [Vicinamibacterales bacterium]
MIKPLVYVCCALSACAALRAQTAAPILVVETSKGTFEIETFPEDAPKTVAHIVDLVKRGFYDGQRVHRALPGFVVQWGDPRSRDASREADWGRGPDASSGAPIGAAEITAKRKPVKGAVAVAHPGAPAQADSQIFVTLADRPDLDGQYAVFGRVIRGEDVPAKLERGDLIVRMSVR